MTAAQVGALALDDHQRDAVDEQHQVGTARLVAARLFDGILLADLIAVALGMGPVDVAERVALGIAVDCLGQGRAEGQQLIDALVGRQQALLERHIQQAAHGCGQVPL